MRHRQFATCGRVVDAQRLAALIDAVQTVGRADARTDIILTPLDNLPHDMRIGHVRAGHADHIQQASRHRMARCRHIGDFRGMEGRQSDLGPDATGKIQMRGVLHALHRDHIGQRRVGVDAAPNDVQEIDLTGVLQTPRDLKPLVRCDAAVDGLVRRKAKAHDKLRSHPFADRVQNVVGKAHPVVQRPAIRRVQFVQPWRPESVHQVAVGFDLDPVEPCRLHPFRRIGIIGDDARDVPIFQLLGKRPMRRFPFMPCGHRR